MLFMDARGKVLTKQGARTVKAFAKTRESCLAFIGLRDNPKPGPAYARSLFFAELALGRLSFADAKKRAAALEGLNRAQRTKIAVALVDLEYDGLAARRFKLKDAYAPKLLAMKQAGRIPSGQRGRPFWSALLRYADQNKRDYEAFREETDDWRRHRKRPDSTSASK